MSVVQTLHRWTEDTTPRWIQLVLYERASGIVHNFPGDGERRDAVPGVGHEARRRGGGAGLTVTGADAVVEAPPTTLAVAVRSVTLGSTGISTAH